VHRGASIIPAGDRRIDRPAQIGQRRENFMPRRAAATLPIANRFRMTKGEFDRALSRH
jgi:hypothetical protein